MNSYSPLLPYTISLGIGITMGLGRCEWYEALAIIWFGCGCWIAFDWRYEFTLSKFLLCLACFFVGSIRSANCCSVNDLGKTFITSINPTNKKGIVELEGYGLAKSYYAYSSTTSEVYLGKLDDVYLNDYFKSFGCVGEYTPIQLLKSSNREPSLKDKYRAIIDSLLCNTIGPAKGIIKGMTTGDKSGISSKDRIQMSNAGIAHILAVSGFHVSLISLIPFLFLKSSRRELRAVSIMGLIGVWVFIIACVSPNSAIRAGIMISIGMLSVILGRRPLPFNTLLLATWILYFHDPLSVFQLGTQLSIVATGAILAIVTHKGSMIMNVPIEAQITTSPFIASTFGTLPIYFLPINIACSIMFPVLALIIAMSFLYRPCLHLASAMVNKAIYMLDGLSHLAFAIPEGFMCLGLMPSVIWVFHRVIPKPLARIISATTLLAFTGQRLADLL